MTRASHADGTLNVPPGRNDVPYPTKLELVRSTLAHMSECASGTVTGTGAAIEIACPFDPAVVLLINRTAPAMLWKTPGMAGDDSLKAVTAGTLSYITANGVTLGAEGEAKFTIGTDADLNTVAEEIEWVAWGFRNSDGSL